MTIAALRNNPWILPTVVATLLLATWAWQADAAGDSDPSSVVTITPARLLDTRDGTDLGLPGPFVNGTSQRLQVSGLIPTSTGNATLVPAGATGVLLNVTSTRSTANGFVSIRPGDATGDPETSSVNFIGGTNTANAVTVALPTTGAQAGFIDISLGGGTIDATSDLFIDVVGYVAIASTSTGSDVQLVSAIQSTDTEVGELDNAEAAENIVTLTFQAPQDGDFLVTANATVSDRFADAKIFCGTNDNASPVTDAAWESAGVAGSIGQLAWTKLFTVEAGMVTIQMDCSSVASDNAQPAFVSSGVLSAIFTPG